MRNQSVRIAQSGSSSKRQICHPGHPAPGAWAITVHAYSRPRRAGAAMICLLVVLRDQTSAGLWVGFHGARRLRPGGRDR